MSDITQRKLSVAFVHPDLGIGGAERLVVDAALSLQERGHDVTIFTSHYDASHAFEPTRDGTLRVVHTRTWVPRSLFHMFHLPMAILQQLSLVMQVVVAAHGAGLAKAAPRLYDALTCVKPGTLPDVFVIDQLPIAIPLFQMLCGKRVLYYCHFPDKEISAALAKQRGDHGLRALVRNVYRFPLDLLEEATTQCADTIIANSHFTAAHFCKVFPNIIRRPYVVYPAVNDAEYTLDRVEAELRMYAKTCAEPAACIRLRFVQHIFSCDDRPMFLSINRFEAKKNVLLALQTVARLQKQMGHVRLVCAGGFDPRVKDNIDTLAELESTAATLGMSHVTVWGKPQSKELDTEEILAADLVLLPSLPGALLHALLRAPSLRALLYTPLNEHFGIVPLEAMVCGAPVVATNTGGPLETVVDSTCNATGRPEARDATGFLRAPDAAQWADVCQSILAWDKDTRLRVAEAAKLRVAMHFSVHTMGAKLDEFVRPLGMQAVPLARRAQILGTLLTLVLIQIVAIYIVLRWL